ncbi:Protein kinase-like (PK-like) [Glarea lozoyensis ATCC 20868]|uniref:Protein kinase-like (PK-like) n=1 Tax=Glarea lozoyensis (strain ATCC 20868 / MF5171) TaxID=1116229 RepID=S3D4P9_GLAL2|nr:Protein kinase-like (PK-like) [Glarea lozoyensis ATCC 20868]EPE32084.1 Protein kinase-like (PK-like) [Glarea lozoyensis ATCC 20868]
MANPQHAPRDLIGEVDQNTWVIGDKWILTLRSTPGGESSWPDDKNCFFVLTNASGPSPPFRPLSPTSIIQKVHDAGDVVSVWKVGQAFIKAVDYPPFMRDATLEHVTINALHTKGISFAIPNVLYNAYWEDRYMIITSAMTGVTLDKAWLSMDQETREYYADRVVDICKEMAKFEAGYIGGIDGNSLAETFLTKPGEPYEYSRNTLLKNCMALRMDCTGSFKFYHCDLGPMNIIVDVKNRGISVIDWERAGFVPIEWIKTKFLEGTGAMYFDCVMATNGDRMAWGKLVGEKLGQAGFKDVAEMYREWHKK